jgi:AraC-like DNA-binding protein
MRLGIADYLLKPVRTETLLQTVAHALAALAEERAHASQLREARLVRLLLGGPRAADADPELLAGPWGVIVTVCENWESPVVWRDTPVGREALARAMAQEGLVPCDIVGIDGHIRVLLAPTAGAPPHALESAARRVQREADAAGLVAHTIYVAKAADESPAGLVPEALRRLGQGMRFAAPTLLGPGPAADAGPGAREQLQLAERALADGRPPAAAAQIHAAIAQLRQERATQSCIVEALDGFFQLFQRQLRPDRANALPDRAALVALLRRLSSYDELATWVDLQLQPLLDAHRGSITPRQLVRALVARVHSGYAGEISLQSFAAENGVSLAYFSRLFKDEVGVTFSDYLTNIRVERAKELLARGDLRPGEVSALVGYEDPKYFSQIFRRAAGMSPLDYQRSRQRDP